MLFFPASLYLGLLQQGAADVGMVSLLILDEVHQVTKEHPYSTLLRDFHWKLPSDCAPKVCCNSVTVTIGIANVAVAMLTIV